MKIVEMLKVTAHKISNTSVQQQGKITSFYAHGLYLTLPLSLLTYIKAYT